MTNNLILSIVASLLTIGIWLFSHKRKKEARKAKILKELDNLEYELAVALRDNLTTLISNVRSAMYDLRNEYRSLNK